MLIQRGSAVRRIKFQWPSRDTTVSPVAKRISFSTLDCLQMQELPKGKDFESIFCRFDGANPDLLPDPEQVTPIVLTLTLRFTAAQTIRVR